MGIRTPDLLNAIEALYQLSYDPSGSHGGNRALRQIRHVREHKHLHGGQSMINKP